MSQGEGIIKKISLDEFNQKSTVEKRSYLQEAILINKTLIGKDGTTPITTIGTNTKDENLVKIFNNNSNILLLESESNKQGGQTQGGTQGGMIQLPPDFVQQLAEAIKLSQQPNIQNDVDEEADYDEPDEEDFKEDFATSGDIQNVAGVVQQVSNQLSDYVNPYRNKTQEEIIKEYEKIGMLYYDNLNESTKDELGERLNFIKKIEEQSKALAQYKMNNPPYIQKDFERATFDMFTKEGDKTPKGIPLSKTYKFIQKIPDINIKFDVKSGFYKCNQDNETYIAKNYKLADKWASLGGFHMDELRELRKIAIKQNNLNDKFYPIFKARKL
jgi:hypothetical protein